MSREGAIRRIGAYFESDGFFDDLARRVAIHTESQEPDRRPELYRYLSDEMQPYLEPLGFACEIHENPVERGGPFLVATRREGDDRPTVMSYGHGDVVRGYDDQWRDGLNPWVLQKVGARWHGRGSADNKGQHTINLAAMAAVIAERGALGFNAVILIETGEENGSPGLREFCAANKALFEADVFIASDGPRLAPERPTIFMGSRGVFNFDLSVNLRDGGHHSGNWGGLLANPGIILAHALASVGAQTGRIQIPEWLPEPMSNSVRNALKDITIDGGENAPDIDPEWGDAELTPAEQVFGWNSFEVLAFKTGNPENPVNAIPPKARAQCQIRFVAGSRRDEFLPALRRHLDDHGFDMVQIAPPPPGNAIDFTATRTDPDHPWARWAAAAMERTTGKKTAVLPNLGGSICNDLFSDLLGLPTIWIPHSYGACSQHAPNEHILLSEARDAMGIMTGLYWDLGEPGTPARRP